jgi:hypothetical protein
MAQPAASIRKIIWFVCVILFILFCIKSFYGIQGLKKSQEDTFASYPKITNTYSSIFSQKALTIIKPSYTFYNKLKNPIATYDVLDSKYQLIVYRMSNVKELPINQLLQINWPGDQSISTEFSYNISIKSTDIQFGDANLKTEAIDRLYLDIDAKIIQEPLYTDSTLSFSLILNALKARHKAKGDVVFYVNKKTSLFPKQAPVNILFLKKNKEVYLLLMCVKYAKKLPTTKNIIYKLFIDTK